jgi:FkbM family methyltransferase
MLRARNLIGIFKPEYLFRPHQITLKFSRELRGRREEMKLVHLPWGLNVTVNTGESIGWSLYTRSIYETAVTEALWRLTKPADLVVDAGANIGYMTSLLAVRVGRLGKVMSFEPHPGVFSQLQRNVDSWQKHGVSARVQLFQVALGDADGLADLHVPCFFSKNAGTAWLGGEAHGQEGTSLSVPIRSLESIIPEGQKVSLVKLDVEGFELAVMKGMKSLLVDHRVHHLVFEECSTFPAPTHEYLSNLGYTIYGIEQWFGGICFLRDQQPRYDPISGPPPNYLATIEPTSVLKRVESGFWQSFGPISVLHQLGATLRDKGSRS